MIVHKIRLQGGKGKMKEGMRLKRTYNICWPASCLSTCRWVSTSWPSVPRSLGCLCRCTRSHNPQAGSAHCGSVTRTGAEIRGRKVWLMVSHASFSPSLKKPLRSVSRRHMATTVKLDKGKHFSVILSELMCCHSLNYIVSACEGTETYAREKGLCFNLNGFGHSCTQFYLQQFDTKEPFSCWSAEEKSFTACSLQFTVHVQSFYPSKAWTME